MRELSLHVMDVVENGITAKADRICIKIIEDKIKDLLTITIEDNGKGMTQTAAQQALDPFITSRTTRRVGLGLSLFQAAAQRCDGDLTIHSRPGKGTKVKIWFRHSHIDRAPIGDMPATIMVLIMGNPSTDFYYSHTINGNFFEMDTRELKSDLGAESLCDPVIIQSLTQMVKEKIQQLKIKS